MAVQSAEPRWRTFFAGADPVRVRVQEGRLEFEGMDPEADYVANLLTGEKSRPGVVMGIVIEHLLHGQPELEAALGRLHSEYTQDLYRRDPTEYCAPALVHVYYDRPQWAPAILRAKAAPPELLAAAAGNERLAFAEKVAIGRHPNTPPDVLARLLEIDDKLPQVAVAENPRLSPQLMQRIRIDEVPEAGCVLAQRPDLPEAVAERLAAASSEAVRARLAENAGCPAWILERLAEDPQPLVRERVAGNPSTPPQVLYRMAEAAPAAARRQLCFNPALPQSVRALLLQDISPVVRQDAERAL